MSTLVPTSTAPLICECARAMNEEFSRLVAFAGFRPEDILQVLRLRHKWNRGSVALMRIVNAAYPDRARSSSRVSMHLNFLATLALALTGALSFSNPATAASVVDFANFSLSDTFGNVVLPGRLYVPPQAI